jgi:hypothetical protein
MVNGAASMQTTGKPNQTVVKEGKKVKVRNMLMAVAVKRKPCRSGLV